MTDTERLREALEELASHEVYAPLDLDQIMAEGGRLRRRRQLVSRVAVAAAVAAVLVLTVVGVRGLGSGVTAPREVTGAPEPGASQSQPRVPDQEIIRSWIALPGGELVFWIVTYDQPETDHPVYEIMAGCRNAAGELKTLVTTNETDGAADAPGFHAIQGAMTIDDQAIPVFGYYVGPAVRITAMIDGVTVRAHQAVSAREPSLVVFWFDPPLVGVDPADPTDFKAFDASDSRLPTGRATVGHG